MIEDIPIKIEITKEEMIQIFGSEESLLRAINTCAIRAASTPEIFTGRIGQITHDRAAVDLGTMIGSETRIFSIACYNNCLELAGTSLHQLRSFLALERILKNPPKSLV